MDFPAHRCFVSHSVTQGPNVNTQQSEALQLVSLDDAAKRLSISRRTIEREISAGRFPRPIKIGRATRITLVALQSYIDKLSAVAESS